MSQVIWTIDAGQVKIEDHIRDFPLFRNQIVNEFLDRDEKFILLGPKGVGKTLLLKLKSIQLRLKGYDCYPKDQPIEIVMRGSTSFSDTEILQFKSSDQWKIIWRMALSTLALRALGLTVPDYKGSFPLNSVDAQIDSILIEILRSRERINEIDLAFTKYISPVFSKIETNFAAFLDRLDETLGKHTGATLQKFTEDGYSGDGHLSYEVWKVAQYGLMEAVRELREKNGRVRFFVTCRNEAFRPEESATAHNIAAICIDLRYTTRELRQMFELKLEALQKISPQSFVPTKGKPTLYDQFFGFTTYQHPRVRSVDGLPIEEHIFDCLLRHTRGSPREIEDLARDIGGIPASERTTENIRRKINEKSNDFLDYAQGQALPYWDNAIDEFVKRLPSNSISRKDRIRLSAAHRRAFQKSEDPFRFLFRHGLVGYARKDEDTGVLIQRFSVNDPDTPALFPELEGAQRIFLHPCLDIRIQASNSNYVRDEFNIIGHAKPFNAVLPLRHVHFGAGKIGCGLVVPLLKARQHLSLCLIQRPSQRWAPLVASRVSSVDVEVNHEEGTSRYIFSVISDLVDESRAKKYINEWAKGERDIILLTSNSIRIQLVLKNTQSISTSVRQEPITDIAAEIAAAHRGKAVTVLPFENDEKCFSLFRKEFIGFPRITVCDVVLDRLCTDQQIETSTISVTTEKYASVHVLVPKAVLKIDGALRLAKPFESSNGFILPNSDPLFVSIARHEDYSFFHEAKRKLVNATHAAAAICGYYELCRHQRPVDPAVWGSYIFQIIARDPDIREVISPIANYFSLRVLKEYRDACRRARNASSEIATQTDLYARACYLKELYASSWTRMRQMPDSISRILPPDSKKMTAKYQVFFGKLEDKDIVNTFGDFADLKALGIDVDETMVRNAAHQIEERFGRVLRYLVQIQA